MSTLTYASNVVPAKELREVQSAVLENLADVLSNSFGPNGSTTCIKKENALPVYTKDGYNILKSIYYHGIIEQSIKDDIEGITRYIVTTVGDGTTSAVLLSNYIFQELNKGVFEKYHPSAVLASLKRVVEEIKEGIKKNAKPAELKDFYDIAMISSDGNEEISANIKNIYEQFGNDVFIDVSISDGPENKLKIYDGLTLNNGFSDSCYINNSEKNICDIRDAHIYFFEDPIDTPEMANFLDRIIYMNIFNPLQVVIKDKNTGMQKQPLPVVNTIIVAPHISKDLSAFMNTVVTEFGKVPAAQRPPLCIVNDVSDMDTFYDIANLCGGKTIRKYIDPNIQKNDIENGRAPTLDNIFEWCGHAEQVVIDNNKTKFINPDMMKNEDGSYSELYKSLITFLESEIKKSKSEGDGISITGNLKRRLNSLKGNMVEYLVGGITPADRDAARDLVEDSVLNTRSAAINGVGRAANYEAYDVALNMIKDNEEKTYTEGYTIDKDVLKVIYNAYHNLIIRLYEKSMNGWDKDMAEKMLKENNKPFNLRTGKCDGTAKSSIESDMIILDSVVKIVGLMFTTNQFIVPSPAHNVYVDFINK